MMRVAWRRRTSDPTTCDACHLAILPGDPYVTWQTWTAAHRRCQRCGVPPRSQVSISRLRPIYVLLEALEVPPYLETTALDILGFRLHNVLTRVRQAYLGRVGKHPGAPRWKARQARAEALTKVLQLLEHVQQNPEHVQDFINTALRLLHAVDPFAVTPLKGPHAMSPVDPVPGPTAHEVGRIKTLRASGYGTRTIARRLGLRERDVRGVA